MNKPNNQRRDFLKKSLIFGSVAGISGASLIASCKEKEENEVTPTEDLMREHGVLTRILFIYDTCQARLVKNENFTMDVISKTVQIVRTFIEDYHEKLEEEHIFPKFQSANKLPELVNVLISQHHIGRLLTNQIEQISKSGSLTRENSDKLAGLLRQFNTMYRPHKGREDTVLFPALKDIVSGEEYRKMGDDFEKLENQLFGKNGFESIVNKVADIEKQLGIYELTNFTPTLS